MPAKKWLVITHFTGAYSGSGGGPDDVWAYVRGVAEAGGIEQDRIPLYSDFSSGGELGFVFAPGTDLKFSNSQASIGAVEVGGAVLHGYLLPNRPAFRIWSLSSADFHGPIPPSSSVVIGTTPTDGWLFVSWVNRDDNANGTRHPQILAQQVCWRRGSTKQTIQHGIMPHDWNTVGTPIPPGSDVLLENASLYVAWHTPGLLLVGLVTEQ